MGVNQPEVIDDYRQRHAPDDFGALLDDLWLGVQVDVPRQALHLRDHAPEPSLVKFALETSDEIESHPAHPARVERLVVLRSELGIGADHAAQTAVGPFDGVV